jgi:hypothetical protein
LSGLETRLTLTPVAAGASQSLVRSPSAAPPRLRVVLRNVIARDGVPPYDVMLMLQSPGLSAGATSVRLGSLDLFGSLGPGSHRNSRRPQIAIIAFEASNAYAELSRLPGFEPGLLRVSIVRRSFATANGGVFTPDDPDPPRIGSIELLQS